MPKQPNPFFTSRRDNDVNLIDKRATKSTKSTTSLTSTPDDLGIKIGRTAIINLISKNKCGFRLNGRRGQWVVCKKKLLTILVGCLIP